MCGLEASEKVMCRLGEGDVWYGSWRFRGFDVLPVKRIATPGRIWLAINLKSFAMYAAEEVLKGVHELR